MIVEDSVDGFCVWDDSIDIVRSTAFMFLRLMVRDAEAEMYTILPRV